MNYEVSRMLYLNINGRCGNQLFQYAFAKKLMLKNNVKDLHIDFYHVLRNMKGDDKTYSDQLCNFNVIPYQSVIKTGDSILTFGSERQKRLFKNYTFIRKLSRHFKKLNLLRKYQNRLHINGIYKEDEIEIDRYISKSKDIFVRGYFENPKYFDDIRDILVEEFTPKFPRKPINNELYKKIDLDNSVCVSFRVWSDLSGNKEELSRREVCTLDYYLEAMDKMNELHPNCHFIIFSNDVAWVKENVKFKYPVSFESGTDEIWEKLRMMYSCKHFIMSTSTFCWWAQYLSRNKDKTVMCPKIWYADGSESKLICKNWLIID